MLMLPYKSFTLCNDSISTLVLRMHKYKIDDKYEDWSHGLIDGENESKGKKNFQ